MAAIQNNGRIEKVKDGIRFYEQDTVMLDYVYAGDLTIDFSIIYNRTGFGVFVIASDESRAVTDDITHGYLVKFGARSFNAYSISYGQTSLLKESSSLILPDHKSHEISFKKLGRYLYLYENLNGELIEIGRNLMANDYDHFRIGIYSNAQNIVKEIKIYDKRPDYWLTNIENTNGGRISFFQNGFQVQNAEKDAEISQDKIHLKAGRYFLSYTASPIDSKLEYDMYVFPTSSKEIHPKNKSIIQTNPLRYGDKKFFDLKEDTDVNILFQINSGKFTNISMNIDPEERYISTEDNIRIIDGSKIVIHLNDLKRIDFKATIDSIPPKRIEEAVKYFIYKYQNSEHYMKEAGIEIGAEYTYTITRESDGWYIIIKDKNGADVFQRQEPFGSDTIEFFYNVSGHIDDMKTISVNNENLDTLHQHTTKKYISSAITGPIIVTDDDNMPLDISASYRIFDSGKYYFTNWEREVFTENDAIQFEHKMKTESQPVVYAIKGDINMNELYHVKDEACINLIDYAAKDYIKLPSDIFTVYNDQSIQFSKEFKIHDYQYYIVDYLKVNSYAINLVDNNSEYEVDISASDTSSHVIYDMSENNQVRAYKQIEPAKDDQYLVLRQSEVKK